MPAVAVEPPTPPVRTETDEMSEDVSHDAGTSSSTPLQPGPERKRPRLPEGQTTLDRFISGRMGSVAVDTAAVDPAVTDWRFPPVSERIMELRLKFCADNNLVYDDVPWAWWDEMEKLRWRKLLYSADIAMIRSRTAMENCRRYQHHPELSSTLAFTREIQQRLEDCLADVWHQLLDCAEMCGELPEAEAALTALVLREARLDGVEVNPSQVHRGLVLPINVPQSHHSTSPSGGPNSR